MINIGNKAFFKGYGSTDGCSLDKKPSMFSVDKVLRFYKFGDTYFAIVIGECAMKVCINDHDLIQDLKYGALL